MPRNALKCDQTDNAGDVRPVAGRATSACHTARRVDRSARLASSRSKGYAPRVTAPNASSPFRFERDMLEPLALALPALLGLEPHAIRIIQEPDLGRVIPDLLIGFWRGTEAPARRRTSLHDAFLLARLESGQWHTPSDIERALYLPSGAALPALQRLARQGLVTTSQTRRWRLLPAAHSRHGEIIAVEAKLQRWRDALAQAVAYRGFADRSYVVLDGARLRSIAALRAPFREHGIGLLLQYGPVLRMAWRSPSVRPCSERRIQAADRLFTSARVMTSTAVEKPTDLSNHGDAALTASLPRASYPTTTR